jgi:glycosyltransferase involved in cell wall biosynthesis
MNILFLIGTLGLGGAEKQLVAWAKVLQADLGARVSVASFDAAKTTRVQALKELGVPVVVAGRDRNATNRIRDVVSFARSNHVDVVHAFSCYLSPMALGTATVVRAVPASSFRGDGLADLRGIRTAFRLPTLSRLRYFTANSQEALARVQTHVRSGALLQYVPNLVTPQGTDARERQPEGQTHHVVAMAAGRLDTNKRFDIFLEALAAARRSETQLRGVVVGDGPMRDELVRRASALGLLPEGVEFLGQLSDLSESYANSDIFVHLAASEGMPNVVLEAMASGLPVVATGAGDVPHIIRPPRTGLLVPFDDVPSTARCLVKLARSPELRARIGEEGRAQVLESHSIQKVRDSLESFYSAMRLL